MKTKLSFAIPILLASLAGVLWWQPAVVTQGATMIASSAGLVPLSGTTGGAVNATISSGVVLMPDGTSGAPAYSFASEPTLGLWRSASGVVTLAGALALSSSNSLSVGGDVTLGAANMIRFGARGKVRSPADGIFTALNNAETIGVEFKVDALPVASACGAGSPAVVAGSTPFSGSVTVGTGGPTTCTITWGGTAYPSAPACTGSVATTTGANARAMGYLGAPTTLTIVPTAAWADSSVVTWVCPSSK